MATEKIIKLDQTIGLQGKAPIAVVEAHYDPLQEFNTGGGLTDLGDAGIRLADFLSDPGIASTYGFDPDAAGTYQAQLLGLAEDDPDSCIVVIKHDQSGVLLYTSFDEAAQLFPIEPGEDIDLAIKQAEELFNGWEEGSLQSDEVIRFLELKRRTFGLWRELAERNRLDELDPLMDKIYGRVEGLDNKISVAKIGELSERFNTPQEYIRAFWIEKQIADALKSRIDWNGRDNSSEQMSEVIQSFLGQVKYDKVITPGIWGSLCKDVLEKMWDAGDDDLFVNLAGYLSERYRFVLSRTIGESLDLIDHLKQKEIDFVTS